MKNISGYVENITFRNEDNGYTVLTLLSGKKEIKCTGTFGYCRKILQKVNEEPDGEDRTGDRNGGRKSDRRSESVALPIGKPD